MQGLTYCDFLSVITSTKNVNLNFEKRFFFSFTAYHGENIQGNLKKTKPGSTCPNKGTLTSEQKPSRQSLPITAPGSRTSSNSSTKYINCKEIVSKQNANQGAVSPFSRQY